MSSSQREQTQAFYKAALEEQQQHYVETEHKVAGTLHVARSSDTSANSPSSTTYNNIEWLDHFRRPLEIVNCHNALTSDMGYVRYRDCACQELPNIEACTDGYVSVSQKVPRSTIEFDPNSVIGWCRDPHNLPAQVYNSDPDRHSWVLGCLMGIRGAHHRGVDDQK